jgi:hypothetical protein
LVEIFYLSLSTVLAPNYEQHSLSPAKVRKVSLGDIYVKCVYFNLFGIRERDIYETFYKTLGASDAG